MTVHFSTDDYECAHGRKPRGRGGWAFSPDRDPDPLDRERVWWFTGTYQEAKRQAVVKARLVNEDFLWVLS